VTSSVWNLLHVTFLAQNCKAVSGFGKYVLPYPRRLHIYIFYMLWCDAADYDVTAMNTETFLLLLFLLPDRA